MVHMEYCGSCEGLAEALGSALEALDLAHFELEVARFRGHPGIKGDDHVGADKALMQGHSTLEQYYDDRAGEDL